MHSKRQGPGDARGKSKEAGVLKRTRAGRPMMMQEYLEDKGIFIGNAEPSTELPLVIPEASLQSQATGIVDGPPSAAIQNASFMPSPWNTIYASPNSQMGSLKTAGTSQVFPPGYLDATKFAGMQEIQGPGSSMLIQDARSLLPIESEATSAHSNPALNLQRLIDFLALCCICIGPAPGLRKHDVERALRHSIVTF